MDRKIRPYKSLHAENESFRCRQVKLVRIFRVGRKLLLTRDLKVDKQDDDYYWTDMPLKSPIHFRAINAAFEAFPKHLFSEFVCKDLGTTQWFVYIYSLTYNTEET